MRKIIPLISALALAGSAILVAQEDVSVEVGQAKPMFAVLPHKVVAPIRTAGTPLPTWNGSFVYSGKTFNYTMVGAAPSTLSSTTVQAVIYLSRS